MKDSLLLVFANKQDINDGKQSTAGPSLPGRTLTHMASHQP